MPSQHDILTAARRNLHRAPPEVREGFKLLDHLVEQALKSLQNTETESLDAAQKRVIGALVVGEALDRAHEASGVVTDGGDDA